MALADELLTQIFWGWVARSNTVSAFRSVARAGTPHAEPEIARRNRDYIERFVLRPDANLIIGDRDEFIRAGYPAQMADQMTRLMLESARMSVDAASIVFAHSMLDDMAFDCVRVVSVAAPADLEQFFDQGTFRLAEIRGSTYETLRGRLMDRYLEKLEKESLLVKVDRLHACCRPPQGWEPMGGYHYDHDRLVRLDTLRQNIVHGPRLSGIPTIDDDLDYLQTTGLYLINLVNHRYGVRIDLVALMAEARRGENPQATAP